MEAVACALAAWSVLGGGLRVAEGRCGTAPAWVVEVDPAAGARFAVPPRGPSRTTADFAATIGADVAINGGLFDMRERPMGPSRGNGRTGPFRLAKRRPASSGPAAREWRSRIGSPRG
ncbi:MAG: hypothetical protein ABR567_19000 [Myxococcales bacterium]|nr:hypothetical protein [Myxococcales bacterium]